MLRRVVVAGARSVAVGRRPASLRRPLSQTLPRNDGRDHEEPTSKADDKAKPPPLSDEAKKHIESLWVRVLRSLAATSHHCQKQVDYVSYMDHQRDKGWKT